MPDPISPDQARARAIVAGLTALVDLQDWERLEELFSERLTLDYTSLWGGESREVGRNDLLQQWKALLPGFDATWHQLGEASVGIDDDTANLSAPVRGTHILDNQAWVVEGRYDVVLDRSDESWRIRSLTYVNEQESGDRALTEEAKSRAAVPA